MANIYGTRGNDIINGTYFNDILDGGSGADTMAGGIGDDGYFVDNSGDRVIEVVSGGIDTVHATVSFTLTDENVENIGLYGNAYTAKGNKLNNSVSGNQVDNYLYGMEGSDYLSGWGGNDTLDGGLGADTMVGGIGDDGYFVDNSGDRVVEVISGGIDAVHATVSFTLTDENVENIGLYGNAYTAKGNKLNNSVSGNQVDNYLYGMEGSDYLSGWGGNDTLDGGLGADTLTGGTGKDVFKFNTLADSGLTKTTLDVITDFLIGQDKIDISKIDANTALAGNQAFTGLIGANVEFTKAGQLRLNAGVLYGNTDKDGAAEFSIALTGVMKISVTDFVL